MFDMVRGEWKVLPLRKDRFHCLGVTSHFLFFSCGKFLDLQASEQFSDISVG
ncbi:hypothetical protein N9383_03750 [Granulosicoccus sp.]|nr:hypothetical protein [Granulosicoccus sp.]